MSMPSFAPVDPNLTLEKSIEMILYSIALEEVAISHIINAEGEKIQYAIECLKTNKSCRDLQKIIDVNKSAEKLIDKVNDSMIILKSKMNSVLEYMPKPTPIEPHFHKHEQIYIVPDINWRCGAALSFAKEKEPNCYTNELCFKSGKYNIEFDLKLIKKCKKNDVVDIEFLFCNKEEAPYSINFSKKILRACKIFTGGLIIEIPDSHHGYQCCSIILKSPCCIDVSCGQIIITKRKD
ncbi:MAG: hypothetical protein FWE14_03405 [Lachnospiraceae bacterium]|nr:hypothetical protein [Lachnospiraceae bacterium]